ncbi:MAG: PilZ domain-containing protein [Myxococcota bacterium]|nr:PilZ domain-containing protein [Myxococcota bacterium]
MVSLELEQDEELLGKGEAAQMVGPLSVPGTLVLTNERIYFEPSRFNKMVGLKPLNLKISKIKSAQVVGIDRVVELTTAKKTVKFLGKWPRTVHDRLQSLLEGTMQQEATLDGFAADERYLLQAPIDYSASSVVMVGGEITVTARTVRFLPSAIERLIWRNLQIIAPVTELDDLKLDGPRRVSFRAGGAIHRFSGSGAREIYAAIVTARQHQLSGRPNKDLIFETWNASIHRGLLAHPGLMVHNADGLCFLVGGTLDQLVGVPEISEYPWNEIRRIDMTSANRLVLTTPGAKDTFSSTDLQERFEKMLPHFARVEGPDVPAFGIGEEEPEPATREAIDTIFSSFGSSIPDLSDQTLALFGPALRVSRKVGTRRGWVAVFDDAVVWLADGGLATGVNPIVLNIAKLQRKDNDDEAGTELKLRLGGGQLRLLTGGGVDFNRRFWSLVGDRAAKLLRAQPKGNKKGKDTSPDVWNRRATYRVALPVRHQVQVGLRVLGVSSDRDFKGVLTDLSLGGAGLGSTEALEVGDTLQIDIGRDGRTLTFEGCVIHTGRVGRRRLFRTGIEFTEQSRTEGDELRNLWTDCQRIEVQVRRGMDDRDILPLDGSRPEPPPPPVPED